MRKQKYESSAQLPECNGTSGRQFLITGKRTTADVALAMPAMMMLVRIPRTNKIQTRKEPTT
jgi:hypothetical protein